MNVIVANDQQNSLSNLDIDVIKSITGTYEVVEIVEMFKSFFYSKMILDVTALNNYHEFRTYEVLVKGLDPEKIIFLLPEGSSLCTPNFLGNLISIGIYNFTTNLNGVRYLLKKANTLSDVEHIRKMANIESSAETGASITTISTKVDNSSTIIGFKNITEHAGTSTFIYILKRELVQHFGSDKVIALEVDSNDFRFFRDKQMLHVKKSEIEKAIASFSEAAVILIDLNNCDDATFCSDVIYLLEPSTIKLNKLIAGDKTIFKKVASSKIVLNKSLLLNNDVLDFENEAGIKVFYNMPPLDERKRNAIINDFLTKLGLLERPQRSGSNKIFGLFRR